MNIEKVDFILNIVGVSVNNNIYILIYVINELVDVRINECFFDGGKYGVWVDGFSGFGIVNNIFDDVLCLFIIENLGKFFNEIKCNLIDCYNFII